MLKRPSASVLTRSMIPTDRRFPQLLLATMQRAASQSDRRRSLITIYLQQAILWHELGRPDQARDAVERAADIAAPQDYRRAFFDEGGRAFGSAGGAAGDLRRDSIWSNGDKRTPRTLAARTLSRTTKLAPPLVWGSSQANTAIPSPRPASVIRPTFCMAASFKVAATVRSASGLKICGRAPSRKCR